MEVHLPKLAICRQKGLTLALTLLLAVGAVLVSSSAAQAASKNRGAVLVKGGGGSGLTNVAGTLYFTGNDRRHGYELWRSDGTRRGTRMVKDIASGRPMSFPDQLTAVGKTVYFTARDGIHGPELWRSDGTARGTRLVKDIVPGQGSPNIGALTNVAGTLFFVANNGTQTALWRSDGTAVGTRPVKDLGHINYPTAVGNILYFAASDGVHAGLWRSDGTASGTVPVKDLQGTRICGSDACYLTNVADTLFFAADHGTQFALWRSDGTEAGTTPVKDGVSPYDLTAVGRTLYFATRDYGDSWLYRSDGTDAGTVPIAALGPTPEGCGCGLEITGFPELTNVGGTLFFFGAGGLSRTDGTPSGTKLLASGFIADQLTAAGKTLYFQGSDRKHGAELWRSDGTRRGTQMVRDIRRGRESSDIGELTAVGKTLFFNANANASVHSRKLWRAGPVTCKARKKKCKTG
jgi:ELWxxDGT repeat protein